MSPVTGYLIQSDQPETIQTTPAKITWEAYIYTFIQMCMGMGIPTIAKNRLSFWEESDMGGTGGKKAGQWCNYIWFKVVKVKLKVKFPIFNMNCS